MRAKQFFSAAVFAVMVLTEIEVQAALLFGATGSGGMTSTLYSINTSTGAATAIGSIGYNVSGLAFDPTSGVLYGLSGNKDSGPAELVTINTATGAGTLVGTMTGYATDAFPDITFDAAGNLFAWTEDLDRLVKIDKSTATATFAGPSVGSAITGLAFDNSGILYRESGGFLDTINPVSGAFGSSIGYAGADIGMGMDFNEANELYAIQRLGGGPSGARNLVKVNTANGSYTLIGSTVAGLDALAFERGVVPEPTSLIVWSLLGLAICGGTWWRHRQRRDHVRALCG